jgi:hypothetical protein
MCLQVVELYAVCHCVYLVHPVDPCGLYGTRGHPVTTRVIYVGYTCPNHTSNSSQQTRSQLKSNLLKPRRMRFKSTRTQSKNLHRASHYWMVPVELSGTRKTGRQTGSLTVALPAKMALAWLANLLRFDLSTLSVSGRQRSMFRNASSKDQGVKRESL